MKYIAEETVKRDLAIAVRQAEISLLEADEDIADIQKFVEGLKQRERENFPPVPNRSLSPSLPAAGGSQKAANCGSVHDSNPDAENVNKGGPGESEAQLGPSAAAGTVSLTKGALELLGKEHSQRSGSSSSSAVSD
jgi:hypothetical protein